MYKFGLQVDQEWHHLSLSDLVDQQPFKNNYRLVNIDRFLLTCYIRSVTPLMHAIYNENPWGMIFIFQ